MKKVMYCTLLCAVVVSANACKNTAKDKEQTKTENSMPSVSEAVVTEPAVVVTEDAIYDVPVPKPTTATKEVAPKSEKSTTHKEQKKATPKISHQELQQNLAIADITPAKTLDTSLLSFSAEPINSTQTVTSYEKKGTEVLKVVSTPTDPDEIDYIVFTDKKNNIDYYGVSAGLTAKEAKQLRKKLKHFVKKGKVFLYTDDSNILYELDGVVSDGSVVTDSYVDNLHISSIIWKDKDKTNKEKTHKDKAK